MNSSDTDEKEKQDVRSLQVRMTVRTWDHGDGVVHRDDDVSSCSQLPTTSPDRSDLETTAVRNEAVGGMDLCDRCEWPEGAHEVFFDR